MASPFLRRVVLSAVAFASISSAFDRAAGDANVDFVAAIQSSSGTWTFSVKVSHADVGWDDYADGWDVVLGGDSTSGVVVKRSEGEQFTRLLSHPHVNEQPFTRSQTGLSVEDGAVCTVRAHDLKDGWGGREVTVDLCQSGGGGYVVTRYERADGGVAAFSPPCGTDDGTAKNPSVVASSVTTATGGGTGRPLLSPTMVPRSEEPTMIPSVSLAKSSRPVARWMIIMTATVMATEYLFWV